KGGTRNDCLDCDYKGKPVKVRKNMLGLTPAGVGVVEGMMDRGMLLDIGNISEATISQVADLAVLRYNYPLISSHTYARRVASPTESSQSFMWEGKLGDDTLKRIADSEGFAGHFMGGDPANKYLPGVANDCEGSTKSLAHQVAYVADRV